ncbi:MAG: Gfo/Idh/MocA family protein [Limisphaerales bacterium]
MIDQPKIGVVGCGYWGPNLVRNLRSIPDCSVQLVCDLSEERLRHMQRLFPEVGRTRDFEHLLNGAGLDAVMIATSVATHFPLAKAALEAGKHVFIEKPMAASSAQCEELIALARSRGLVLMVGYTFLYSPAVRKIKEIIDAGDIGELRYINARRLNLGLFQKDINVAWDLAPHDLSIILHVMAESPLSINCSGTAHVPLGNEDVTTMFLKFPSQRSAVIQNSWLDPRKIREMTFVGSRGMIVYDDVASFEKIRIFDVRVERPPHYDNFGEFQYAYHYGDMHVPHLRQEEPLKVECEHFVDCVRHDLKPLSDGPRGLDVVRLLEAASLSLQQGGGAVEVRINGRCRPPAAIPSRIDLGSDSTPGSMTA